MFLCFIGVFVYPLGSLVLLYGTRNMQKFFDYQAKLGEHCFKFELRLDLKVSFRL